MDVDDWIYFALTFLSVMAAIFAIVIATGNLLVTS